jgi:hypothetical protein
MTWLYGAWIAAGFFSAGFGAGAYLSTRDKPASLPPLPPMTCPHGHHDWDQCPVCCH